MPPSARSRRPQAAKPAPAVIRTEDSENSMDPMDIVLGVIWAVAIPAGMYLILYLAGMPPGGGGDGASWGENMKLNDQLGAVNPPVTYREVDLRLALVDELLQDRVPDYLQRAKTTKDNRVKNWWQELAFRVLGVCRNELEQVSDAIPGSAELVRRPEIGQGIRNRLAHIESEEEKIIRDNPFPDRLREAQREAVQSVGS